MEAFDMVVEMVLVEEMVLAVVIKMDCMYTDLEIIMNNKLDNNKAGVLVVNQ